MAVVVAVGATLVLPTGAFAATKAATRFYGVASSRTVHNDVPGTDAWPVSLVVKLQKKSGSKWVGLSSTVKLYKYNFTANTYSLVASKKGSSVTFTIAGRGRYKIYYAGSSTTKAATTYSTFLETIGDTIAGSSDIRVTVTYTAGWNTDAWDGPVHIVAGGDLENTAGTLYDAAVNFDREIWAPRTCEFSYRVTASDMTGMTMFSAEAGLYVASYDDPYFYTPSDTGWISTPLPS
jgi:hypothetical protein